MGNYNAKNNDVFQVMPVEMEELNKVIEELNSSFRDITKTMQDFATVGTEIKAAVENSGFKALCEQVKSIVKPTKEAFSQITGAVKSVDKMYTTMFNNASKKAADFSGTLKKLSDKSLKGVNKIQNGLADLTTQKAFEFSTKTGRFSKDAPLIWKMIDKIGPKFSGLGSVIGSGLQKGVGVGVQAMTGMVSAMASILGIALRAVGPAAIIGIVIAGFGILQGPFGQQINDMIQMVATQGPQVIQGFVDSILSGLPALMTAGSQMIANILNAITENLPMLIQGGIQILSGLIQGLITNFPLIMPAVSNLLVTFVTSVVSGLPQILVLGIELLTALAQGIIQSLPQLLKTGVQSVQMLVNGILQNLPTVLNAVVNLIDVLIQGIVSNLPSILLAGLEIIVTLATGLLQALPHVVKAMIDIARSIKDSIMDLIKTAPKWGLDLINGFADGIKKAAKCAIDAVCDVAQNITSLLHFSRPDEGPLRSYEHWMPDFMKGLASGITSNMGLIENAVSKVASIMDFSMEAQFIPNVRVSDFDEGVYKNQLAYAGIGYSGDELNSAFNYKSDLNYTIIVPLDIEGREIARATAVYTQEELNRIEKFNNRKAGYR